MGVLGTKIIEDDLAADVQARFREIAAELSSDADATQQLMAEYRDTLESTNPDDGSTVFWIALADVQWNTGRLQENVKAKTLEILESGSDLERWPGDLREERRKVLDELRARLHSDQPKRKRLAKPFVDRNDWEPGQIIAYRRKSGQRVLFRVLGSYEGDGTWLAKSETCPLVEFLDWQGEEIPSVEVINSLKIRRDRSHSRHARAVLFRHSERDRRSSRFEITGIRSKRTRGLREISRHLGRKLLIGLAMTDEMESPNSTCRSLHVPSLDKELADLYGF